MDLSKNIREIREKLKIKQIEIAERLGIDPANYSRIEKKGNNINFELLQQIADVFKMSVVEIIEYPNGNTAGDEERVKALEGKIINLENDKIRFAELSDERKARLIFLEKLTSKIADCLEKGYAILSKIEKQSPEIQKEIQDFVRQYDRLEEQIKQIDKET
jgi:transcriptional regulator with XRE-family HTH domain